MNVKDIMENNQDQNIIVRTEEDELWRGKLKDIPEMYQGMEVKETAWSMANKQYVLMVPEIEREQSKSDFHINKEQYQNLLDQLRIELIPTEYNRELLEKAAHVEMEDLSMIVYAMAPQGDGSTKRILVTDAALDAMGIDREQFLHDAIRASEKNYPAKMQPLSSFLFGYDEGPAAQIYVASTQDMTNGAAVIMYPEFMDRAAKELRGNFFILPSSIHEVLLLRDDNFIELEQLKETVHFVNKTEVPMEDVLSNNVYHFDASERKLEIGDKYQDRISHEKENRQSLLEELSANKPTMHPSARAAKKKDEPAR
ncbi:MAG: DUF5688 family protein [Eubacteriales bacterium]